MVHTFVDYALAEISRLESYRPLADSLEAQIQDFQVDLRLLQMFLRFLFTRDPYKDSDRKLLRIVSTIQGEWDKSGQSLYAATRLANDQRNFKDWNIVDYRLAQNIQECKDEIKKYCVHLMSCSSLCEPFASDQILEFIYEIIYSLKHLHRSMENQVETLKVKLLLLRNSVDFVAGSCPPNVNDLRDFLIHAHEWASKIACLTCLHWAGGVEEDHEIGSRTNEPLIDLLRKVNPCTPEFIGMCFQLLKLTKSSRSDTFVFNEFVTIFVDLLLENLQDPLKNDIEFLREGLIFLISFLADPPAEDHAALTSLQSHADSLLGEASQLICLFNKTEEDLIGNRASLFDVLRKIHDLRRQIEMLHVRLPDFSLPKTNRLWFVENLLGKIEDLTRTMSRNQKIAPFSRFQFAKHHIFGVKEGLMSLSQSIHVVWELQNEHEELKDLLDRMIVVTYKAELAVNSSFTIDHPIWYHLLCLSYVLREIKDVQNEYAKFKTNQIYGITVVSILPSVNMPPDHKGKGFDEVVVGFDDEKQVLIDRITRGTKHLDIVPIVGMGGLGKTTLAKNLFRDSSVRYDFNVRAFCHVGQEHYSRLILLDILNEFSEIDNEIHAMTRDDLAHRLYKCLKGRRYLIVMDDIWDVDAWKGVKDSFPEDNNGSRIVFTTRISNVALQAKANCAPHYLRFLLIDESWGLLQAKVFHEHHCPPHLQEVGMLIAKKCNGLPLAVVVIAGLLAKIPASLSSWNRVIDDLTSSYASTLGCMETLELSYKHLPEALKSCLLYFGAFVKEKIISAKRLMLLWAAEGFVPKSSERNNFLSMANQYLNNLIDRSLVIVHKRSSTGGIKECYVHDLIRDLCQTKARDEQFFHFIRNDSEIFSRHEIYEQYRLCSHVEWMRVGNAKTRTVHSTAHTLLYYPISDKTLPIYKVDLPYSKFKLLQVFDLQDAYRTHSRFPEEVTMLVNLRYLALLVGFISRVPSRIVNLWNLETLILRSNHWERSRLPETIWKMKRLRHIDAGDNSTVDLDNDVGKDSSKLANVESFSSVTIVNGEYGEELLRRLSSVRKLRCHYPSASPCWDGGRKFELLPKLDKYLTVLESLHIASRGVGYPCVFNFPVTLKKLNLRAFGLPWSEISEIAKLPCLEVLKVSKGAFSGSRWDAEKEEFPNLKFLKLHMLDVADWIASVDTFPCLEQLVVIKCDKLVEIPACFGEVPTLKAIEVYSCKKGLQESAIQIQNEQLEMGNQSLQVRVKP